MKKIENVTVVDPQAVEVVARIIKTAEQMRNCWFWRPTYNPTWYNKHFSVPEITWFVGNTERRLYCNGV